MVDGRTVIDYVTPRTGGLLIGAARRRPDRVRPIRCTEFKGFQRYDSASDMVVGRRQKIVLYYFNDENVTNVIFCGV